MEFDGDVDRRTLLAGALGTLGLVAAGCSRPPPELRGTTKPSPVITSVRPRPHPSTAPKPASAREIIKRATVPVLCYHQLRNWTSSDSQYNRVNLICPPARFRAHLEALAENGWTTISPGQYLRHLNTGAALPPKPIMLSFDDGTAGQAHEGLVQLTRRGMTGTFFVMTVVLGKPKWMSIRDIHRLADAGMTIGSHTWDHHAVSDLSGSAWKVQLEQSRETLRKASGQSDTSPTRTESSAPRRSPICPRLDTRPPSSSRPRSSTALRRCTPCAAPSSSPPGAPTPCSGT
jgi:peptidoglycan/xylan/chitin deacetylase (PgdA/CDA1 family)